MWPAAAPLYSRRRLIFAAPLRFSETAVLKIGRSRDLEPIKAVGVAVGTQSDAGGLAGTMFSVVFHLADDDLRHLCPLGSKLLPLGTDKSPPSSRLGVKLCRHSQTDLSGAALRQVILSVGFLLARGPLATMRGLPALVPGLG